MKSDDPENAMERTATQIMTGNRIGKLNPVKVPLVLVSQVQRSGGTLLTQLFDGHPALMAHPSELYIGKPSKYFWPHLNLAHSPDELFESLLEPVAEVHAQAGYHKYSPAGTRSVDYDFHPFIFIIGLQRQIFLDLMKRFPATSQRNVLECYAASYFGAWLDYQGAYRPLNTIRYWTAFAPRLMTSEKNRNTFFEDYPDGFWVSVLRDPVSWYASASQHNPAEYADLDKAMQLWIESYSAVLDGRRECPGRVIVLAFEDLVRSPVVMLQRLCERLGILFDPILLQPTFNSIPILADSSFDVAQHGILLDPADRSKLVSEADRKLIRERTMGLYERVYEIREF